MHLAGRQAEALPLPFTPDAVPAHQDEAGLDRHAEALEGADWRPEALAGHLGEILRLADCLEPWQRTTWQIGLRRAWQTPGAALADEDWNALFELLTQWSDWPLLLAMVDAALHGGRPFTDQQVLAAMAAAWRLGETEWALALGVQRRQAAPANDVIDELHQHLETWRDYRATLPWPGNGDDIHAELILEPMGHHHGEDFCWQNYAPDITELCCLPEFTTPSLWHLWMDYVQGESQFAYAIIHRTWGFVGSVHLMTDGDCGFLYYWLGEDFRGFGFAAQAAGLIRQYAMPAAGVRACYAKVFEHNTPSRRTLERIGFTDTGLYAALPRGREVFYRLGSPIGLDAMKEEFHRALTSFDAEVLDAMVWPASSPQGISGERTFFHLE